MAHVTVPEAEAILDKEYPVLDHGFVRLVDYMGGDSRIVASARVSYGAGTTSVRRDRVLIDYLISQMHTSPFEQVVMTFHAKMPIFVARQWIRHRTARVNEISGRYSVMTEEFYVPEGAQLRKQSKSDHQSRGEEEVPKEVQQRVLEILRRDQGSAYASYQELLKDEIARELARINLPLSLYTQWYWQIDLHNLLHFLRLRLDAHAQYEIGQYAIVMAKMAKAVAPMAYEAFDEHVLHSVRISRSKKEKLAEFLRSVESDHPEAKDLLKILDGEYTPPK